MITERKRKKKEWKRGEKGKRKGKEENNE